MPLDDVLIDVITERNLGSIHPSTNVNGENAKLLWGINFQKRYPETEQLTQRFQIQTKCILELVYEDESGNLYMIHHHTFSEDGQKSGVAEREDTRWRVFGSKELYKKFFRKLNESFLSGNISGEDFMALYNNVQDSYSDIYSKATRFIFSKLFGREMITKYAKGSRVYPMLRAYLNEAKSST